MCWAAADYLLNAKCQSGLSGDPVARFHLGNRAIVHTVHADADRSENGLKQSHGAMVNDLYDLGQVAHNHETFVTTQQVPTTQKPKDVVGPVARPAHEKG